MRSLFILIAICFTTTVFAETALPKVGNKRLVQIKPKEPMGLIRHALDHAMNSRDADGDRRFIMR